MAQQWSGQIIFNSNAERDRNGRKLEDFIQARQHVLPHPDPNITADSSGVEYRNNYALGEDSGPGVLFTMKMPDDETVLDEMGALWNEIVAEALSAQGGNSSIPD